MAGRRESPLEPSAGPVARFAADLRKLRAEADSPTYRVMADRSGQGASTLSQAAGGERLPTLPVVLAYVRACGGNEAQWEARWRETAAEVAAEPRSDLDDVEPPYRGLARFEPADADRFFGRDQLTDRLLHLAQSRRFTAVFGPSGSGKSSLLRAGLIPRLQQLESAGQRPAALRVLTPGDRPLQTHEQRLVPADADGDTWLIVDQFEELYTLCNDPAERDHFIDRLLAAIAPDSRLRVIIAVRADFLGRCAEHPGLTTALQDATVLAGPMTRDELREAIVKPAQTTGLIVERPLTARLLNEVDGEPGALPLMSHALLETWHRRTGRALTQEAYEAAGGLHGAIARTAEDVHAHLTASQAALARRIVLRLITPGEGTPDTRRPTPRGELEFGDTNDTAKVLERLVRARLLTLEHDTVDLAHEALITAWPRLQTWINEARDRLRLHRQLTEAARTWDDLNRDPGALYRGTRLTAAEETFLHTDVESDLTSVEHDFLTCSTTARLREEEAASRTTRRLRHFTVTLSILLVLSLTAGLIAWQQYRASEQRQQQALTAQKMALSRQLAAQSSTRLENNPDLAALLAVQAYRTSPTNEATASLFAAAALPLQHRLTGHRDIVESVTFSPDGHTLASGSYDKTIRLWDTATGRLRIILTAHAGAVDSVAFSPDGHTLASGSDDGKVRLWETATGMLRATLTGRIGRAQSVAFSPDGHTLASGSGIDDSNSDSDDGKVRLWDVATGKLRTTLTGHTGGVQSVAFSPDGRTLASGTVHGIGLWDAATGKLRTTIADQINLSMSFSPNGHTLVSSSQNEARLWDVATGKLRTTLTGHTGGAESVAFSPDGRTLASGNDDGKVRLWETATGKLRATLSGHRDIVESVAFSPDGRTLASGSDDDTIRLWDTATGAPPATLPGHTNGVESVAFSPNGRTLASGGSDGEARLWDVATGKLRTTLTGDTATVESVAFSPNGRTLATSSDYGALLWETATGKLRTPIAADVFVHSVAFSPDGRTLAGGSGSDDGKVRLWETATGKLHTTLTGHTGVQSVAFSPNGRTLASGSDDGKIRLWDVATGGLRTTLTGDTATVETVAFSPNGRTLASGSDDGKIRLWDVSLPDPLSAMKKIYQAVHRALTRSERSTYLAGAPSSQRREE